MSGPQIFVEPGQRFGRLVVLQVGGKTEVSASRPQGWRAAICRCDCGEIVTAAIPRIVSGKKRSCGCLKRDAAEWTEETPRDWSYQVTHGLGAHPLYDTWYGMMVRCHNPRNKAYRNYGARGIAVHEPWRDLHRFIADIEVSIGPRPEGRHPGGRPLYTLDRWPNNDGNYEPGNVRWATSAEQRANIRRKEAVQCSEDDCVRPSRSHGLCTMHDARRIRRERKQAA